MRFGRYKLLAKLGKGSMGIVYKAHDPNIDRPIALKVMRQDRVTSQDFVQRFLKEARAIGKLSHPNIVSVYDAGQDRGALFIAMEFLVGKSLEEIIKNKRLGPHDIVKVGVQVAEALDYAHQQGIVHRDIKPSNIILTPDDQVKITDFGIARIEDPSATQQTQAGQILGTPAYMSPEQVKGAPVDCRTDLFSLGVILYELITGNRPFTGDSIAAIFSAILLEDPAKLEVSDSPMRQSLNEIVVKSLNKSPEKRFQSGIEMANPLKKYLQRRQSDTVAMPQRPPKKKHRLGLMAAIAMILLSLIGGAVLYMTSEQPMVANSPTTAIQALLKVKSDPTGAQVFLDGSFKGQTPLEFALPLGKYEVRLSSHNYYEWESQLQLNKEGETPLFVKLVPMDEKSVELEEKPK
ncbi:MAG: serine/threonine protein kinase [Desulfobacterales bacterium]|nr:serine/threonine protein kinase [Desulfobacterales bacterium]